LPHDPQLFESVLRLVQPLPHAVCPVLQAQLPAWQVAPMHWV
jgi:hypothetical protein